MEINKIRTLTAFKNYCESVNEESNDIWLLSAIISGLTPQEFLNDCIRSMKIYLHWLKVAQDGEHFQVCAIIYKALQQELAHYKELSKSLYEKIINKSLNKSIDLCFDMLKQQYLVYE